MSSRPEVSATTYCAKHSDTPTRLQCGRCDTPVCQRCMVHAPVGIRCPDCANVRSVPTFDVTTPFLARAVAAAVVLGTVGGTLFALLGPAIIYQVAYLDTLAIAGLGYAVGEGVSLSANRKRGRTLKYVAAGGMGIAYLIIFAFGPGYLSIFHLISAGIGIYIATNRF